MQLDIATLLSIISSHCINILSTEDSAVLSLQRQPLSITRCLSGTMTPTNIFLVALLAFINLATADGVPTNTSSLTTSSTEETWALITTWTTLACSTAPGTNDSAVVYGSTYSIPVNYGTCDPNDPGCEEAGRRCGIVPGETAVTRCVRLLDVLTPSSLYIRCSNCHHHFVHCHHPTYHLHQVCRVRNPLCHFG